MSRRRPRNHDVVQGRANVFADLGFARPEEELRRAKFGSLIREAIRRKRLSLLRAAALMKIDRSNVSALLNGRLSDYSSAQLVKLLAALE